VLPSHARTRVEGKGSARWTTAEVLVRIAWGETYEGRYNGKFLNITGILPTTRAGGYYALY